MEVTNEIYKYFLQPHKDKNELFAAIRPQLMPSKKKNLLYGPRHMRMHLLEYTKENFVELEVELKKQLIARRQSLQSYIELMEWTPASGSEITLLILCRMYNITILVVRSDFLWLSRNVAPLDCDVVLVQNCNGHFLGTHRLDCKLVEIGDVPRYIANKKKSPSMTTSTPIDRMGDAHSDITQPDLSPIGPKPNTSATDDSAFSLNETSESTERIRNELRKLEEISLQHSGEKHAEKTPKKIVPICKLNIKDIGNESSSEISPGLDTSRCPEVLTPKSSSAIDVTSPEECDSNVDVHNHSDALLMGGKVRN